MFGSIEEGRRCEELAPVLSAFVDGETSSRLATQLQAHLKECSHCRAEVRAYRAAPRAAAALAPALPAAESLADRFYGLAAAIHARLPGRTGAGEAALGNLVAAGGTRGTGMAVGAKILAACVGTAGGAAACMATGVVPPVPVGGADGGGERIERVADQAASQGAGGPMTAIPESAPQDSTISPPAPPPPEPAPAPEEAETPPASEVSAEFTPEPPPAPVSRAGGDAGAPTGGPAPGAGGGGGGAQPAAGGEFGP